MWSDAQLQALKQLKIPLYECTAELVRDLDSGESSVLSEVHGDVALGEATAGEETAVEMPAVEVPVVEKASQEHTPEPEQDLEPAQKQKPEQPQLKTQAEAEQTAQASVTTEIEQEVEPNVEKVEKAEEENPTFYYYQLGPWLMSFSELLPVEGLPWLQDLSAFVASQPTQISPAEQAIPCDAYMKSNLTPEEKKSLWEKLQRFDS